VVRRPAVDLYSEVTKAYKVFVSLEETWKR